MAGAPQQEGIENSLVDYCQYYDIMIIGMTGQGKSTTADKLLIANPTGEDYSHLQFTKQINEETRQLQVDDISMWLLSGKSKLEDEETRLKFLSFCRKKERPHEEVNDKRDHDPSEGPSVLAASTKECEVISNDTSKVRVLDVPGFFDGDDIKSATSPTTKESTNSVNDNNLGIMRKIIHAQTALRLKFQRILYFLPVRGPLQRANAILKLDLQAMAHYFGKSMLKCMVIVATISTETSCLPIDESQKFSERSMKRTSFLFKKALEDIYGESEDLTVPPIIFISMTDSCETILKKVKEAPVVHGDLQLEFDPSVCADCGLKIGEVHGERVVGSFGQDWSTAIPYNESTCHPVIIPKYSTFDKIIGGVVYVVTFGWARGKSWPVFEGEVCAGCREEPGKPGCMQVWKEFNLSKKVTIKVDHTNKITEVVADEENHVDTGNNVQENDGGQQEQINPRFKGETAGANQPPN